MSPWSATELLRCGAALARVGYVPSPAWRQAFFGRVLRLAKLPPAPMAVAASEEAAAPGLGAWQGQGQGREARRHLLSGADVALLLSCSQRWSATASEATLTALLYGVPYEVWSPRAAARACRLLALQQLQQQQIQTQTQQSQQPLQQAQAQAMPREQEQQQEEAAAGSSCSSLAQAPPEASGLGEDRGPSASSNRRPPSLPPSQALNGLASAPTHGSAPTAAFAAAAAATSVSVEDGPAIAIGNDGWASDGLGPGSDLELELGLGLNADLGAGDGSAAVPVPAVVRARDVVLVAPRPRPPSSSASSPSSPSASRSASASSSPLASIESQPYSNGVAMPAAAAAAAAATELLSYSPGADGSGARREEVLQRGPGRPAAAAAAPPPQLGLSASLPSAGAAALARAPATVAAAAAAAAAATPTASPRPAWSPAAAAAAVSYIDTWPVDSSGSDGDGDAAIAAAAAAAGALSGSGNGRGGDGSNREGRGGAGAVPSYGPGPAAPPPPLLQVPASPPPPSPSAPPAQRFVRHVFDAACASLERQHAHRLVAMRPAPPPPPAPRQQPPEEQPPEEQQQPQVRRRAAAVGGGGSALAAPRLPSAPGPSGAALDGPWGPLSLSQVLWAAARLRFRPSPAQRQTLSTALTAVLMRWSALPPHAAVPLLWACRRLAVPLGPGPAALLRRALLLHPGLQPGALSDGELLMLLEACVGWRLDPPTQWAAQVPSRLAMWLGLASPAVAAATAQASTFKWRLAAAAAAESRPTGRRGSKAAAAAARTLAIRAAVERAAASAAAQAASGVEARQLLLIMRALRRLQLAARGEADRSGGSSGGSGGGPGSRRPYAFRLKLPPAWTPAWAPVPPSKAAAGRLHRGSARSSSAGSPGAVHHCTALDDALWSQLWPMLRTAVRRRLAEVFGPRMGPPGSTAAAAAAAAAAPAAVTSSPVVSPRERLAALMCGAACGLVDWEAWGLEALRRLAGELPPRDTHAWLALASGLRHRVARGSAEDLLLAWCIATGPQLESLPPRQLHATLRLAGRVAESLRQPMPWEWVSVAVRRYSRCVGELPPAQLAQVPAVLRRLRRMPPPRWQMSYAALVVRQALPYLSGPRAQALLRGAVALSPGLAVALRGPVHGRMTELWVQQQEARRRRRQAAAARRVEHRRRQLWLRRRYRA